MTAKKAKDIFEKEIKIKELIENDPAIEFSVDSLWEMWKDKERPKMSKIEFAQKHKELIFLHAYTIKSGILSSLAMELQAAAGISLDKITPYDIPEEKTKKPKSKIIVPGNNKIH